MRERRPDQKRIVASLATEADLPVGDVAALYERERSALALGAHVTKYLDILATRNVQEIVRKRRLGGRASPPAVASVAGR